MLFALAATGTFIIQKMYPLVLRVQKTSPVAGMETAYVSRVIDGDTIELKNGDRVRYIGMDAPETVDPEKPVQCFGTEASLRNKELVEGKFVRLEKDVSNRDKYGRLLRFVYLPEATSSVDLQLISEGFARALAIPPDIKYSQEFAVAERNARATGKGLWRFCMISRF